MFRLLDRYKTGVVEASKVSAALKQAGIDNIDVNENEQYDELNFIALG
jgi:hypothetical protein